MRHSEKHTRPLFRLLVAAALAGCAFRLPHVPNLGGLYDRAAQVDDRSRNPVIVIPGILGSRLVDGPTGRVVWGAFAGTYANPTTADGARLLALPMRQGAALGALRDEVEAVGVLDRVRVSLFGLPFEQKAYLQILSTLGVGGYRDQDLGRSGAVRYPPGHFTCFQFAYDWRRDNAENARRLDEFIREKKAYVTGELERRHGKLDHEVRFDIIAHSMGGLLLRYYLLYGGTELPDDGSLPSVTWAGAKDVDKVVLVGTPNGGSAHALLDLVEGVGFSIFLPRFPAAVLGTMPSIYELLPRTRHRAVVDASTREERPIDVFDAEEWERRGWGVASPDAERSLELLLPDVPDSAARRRIALDHLRKALRRAKQFQDALDRPTTPPGLTVHLFAGDSEDTPAVLEANASGSLRVRDVGPGDGTVLRTSAVMDERVGGDWRPGVVTPIHWSGVTFVFADHLALTRDPAFTDTLLYRLLEAPKSRTPMMAAR